jgi:hypothetical protein
MCKERRVERSTGFPFTVGILCGVTVGPCGAKWVSRIPRLGVSCLTESSRGHACIMGEHSMLYRKSFQVSSFGKHSWQVSFFVLVIVVLVFVGQSKSSPGFRLPPCKEAR